VSWHPEGAFRGALPLAPLSASEEIALGRAIRDAEDRVLVTLRGVACVGLILGRAISGRYRTRAAIVDRLDEAVQTVIEKSRTDAALRPVAREAWIAWSDADALRWRLAMSQQRIAFHEARKVAGRFLDRSDLTQEGYLGLLRAAKRFDPDRGLRFSTYARWWVRAQITRAVDQGGRVVRLPGAAVEQLRNLRKVMQDHERAGTRWTIGGLAREIGVDHERAALLLSRGETLSFADVLDDDARARPLAHTIADERAPDPLDVTVRHEEESRARRALAVDLDERLRRIVMSRFGLDGNDPQSLAEVGRRLALSRERVRQLEKEALETLRDGGAIR
jgi:RNA polymerase sigma factor (sigma-70 family)